MDRGLVSIIMPSYNCGRFVRETIDSVLAQTYTNWELLFVDDCSTDDTESIVKSYGDPRILFFKNNKNSGAAVSRNWALREAKGRWIAFLDSDDLWVPEKLERQIHFMEEHNFHFSYTETVHIDEKSQLIGRWVTGPRRITKRIMLWYCWCGCLSVMYDADVIGMIQIADLKKNNDYAIWLKAIKKADCYLLTERLSKYRERRGSISSSSTMTLLKWHYLLFREGENMSVLMSIYSTFRNMVGSIIKKHFYTRKLINV